MEPMQVAVRLRPLVSSEINSGCRPCIERITGLPQIIVGSQHQFSFNYVFDEADGQLKIYESCVQPMITKLFEGYNATILAYGQTGTGKTYTMGTNYSGCGEMGIIPRAILEIFENISHSSEKCQVSVSFIELYNEILYDLLTMRDREESILELRESGNSLVIPGLTLQEVNCAESALNILNQGSLLRVTGATNMNATSSRSHAVFTVNLKIISSNDPKNSVHSKFHLVDLAGSERAKKTGTSGDRFKEGVNINKGLLMLGNVISQLGGGNASYINYRDSKLTRLLQDSLGGNSYTLMIACVSPADSNQEESICTLRYADRVKKIKNKPVVNVDPQVALISRLKKEVETLRLQIISPDGSCPPSHKILEEKLMSEMKRNSELSSALKLALQHNPAIYERSLMMESVSEKTKGRIAESVDLLKKAMADTTITDYKDLHQNLLGILESIQSDHVQADKEMIDHSKREQEEDCRQNSDGNHVEPPDDVKEQHVLFQAETNKEIEALTKNLILKMDLYDQLQKNSGELAHLNDSGHSVQYLTNLVKQLESEKQTLLSTKAKFTTNRFGHTTHHSGTPENIQQRLHQLENELEKTQKKLAEQEKLLKFKAKSDEKIVSLKKEIQSMKAMKVQLIHQMKAENDRFRHWQNEKNREVCKLRNLNNKQNNQISKMEREFTLRQAVLRRKLEAAAAAKKRIEQAVDRRNVTYLKKAKDFEPEKLEEYIIAEIDLHESISYAKKSLQNLLDDRSSLMKEIQIIQDVINKDRKNMTPEDLENYEKKKTIMEQELELQSTQIADLQQKILNSRQDEDRKRQRWEGIKSLVEAKHALYYLFTAVSKAKKDALNLNDITKELKVELEEEIKKNEKIQSQLTALDAKNKKKCDEIIREYEEKIYEVLSQKKIRNGEDEDEGQTGQPLGELSLNTSANNQSTCKRKISEVCKGVKLSRGPHREFEIAYLKFAANFRKELEASESDENVPPLKKNRQPGINDETFDKSMPINQEADKSSNQAYDLFEMSNYRTKDRKFFEDIE